MRVRRASTSWDTSLTIFAFSLGDSVVNHLARRWSTSSVLPQTCTCFFEPGHQERERLWENESTYHLTLAGEQDQVAATCFVVSADAISGDLDGRDHIIDGHVDCGPRAVRESRGS